MRDRSVDIERWGKFTLIEKRANIGAEVGRTYAARRSQNEERYWRRSSERLICSRLQF